MQYKKKVQLETRKQNKSSADAGYTYTSILFLQKNGFKTDDNDITHSVHQISS